MYEPVSHSPACLLHPPSPDKTGWTGSAGLGDRFLQYIVGLTYAIDVGGACALWSQRLFGAIFVPNPRTRQALPFLHGAVLDRRRGPALLTLSTSSTFFSTNAAFLVNTDANMREKGVHGSYECVPA